MVEKLDHLIIKSEPFYSLEDTDLLNGIVNLQQELDLRTLCLTRLGLCEDTLTLLEAQQIDIECLKKMRFEDVDALFETQPLGPKINFREALISWRIDIGMPMKSLRMGSYRKRSAEQEVTPFRSMRDLNNCNNISDPIINTPTSEGYKPKSVPRIAFRTFPWPMTPEILKDILSSCSVGRFILHSGELGSLEKTFQGQLTAIVIDYHMEYDTKITAQQLDNYSRCITTLFPHENKNTYHIPRGPTRRNPGGSLYSRFINQKISKKALAIGSGLVAPFQG
ncbi:uncharacterized protein LOC131438443 [Malaya genurostris]|uniref:uncharacterized protein LOC131438443 n=1 Tax=Malaya genurostris TaxID=325434 RepID=UPI0026F3A7BF|nr:uncharacterized protein LOC131438443 [Malaya genurostris]